MTGADGNEQARRLGAQIRNRRLAQGMSLRALANALGLSGHGTLVDYEYGRRIPPEDLIAGCERIFQITDGALRNLRDKALAERANQQADQLLADRPPTAPAPARSTPERPAQPPRPPQWRRAALACAALAVVAGVGIGAWQLGQSSTGTAPRAASTTPLLVSRTVVAHWGICWGGQAGSLEPSDAVTYQGTDTLQITVDKPSTDGLFATCTAHGLSTLHSGMKVTVYVRVPAAENEDGIGFWVYDSHFTPTYAPQTPQGVHLPLPAATGWQKYTWTVPTVDSVHSLGLEIASTTDRPVIVWLGAVAW
jgi:transcriptional regulator with XRE-family HTH domain